jgi:nucleoside phosphorylase
MPFEPVPPCDRLLLLATSAEEAALKAVAREKGLQLTGRTDEYLGKYRRLHRGDELLAIAVRTEMGSVGPSGSAVMAWRFVSATQAATIVQVGMAFGISPTLQKVGDVLVARSLLAYDQRDVTATPRRFLGATLPWRTETVTYPRVVPLPANPSLVTRCERYLALWGATYPDVPVRFGAILSGGAAISCTSFRVGGRLRAREFGPEAGQPFLLGGVFFWPPPRERSSA